MDLNIIKKIILGLVVIVVLLVVLYWLGWLPSNVIPGARSRYQAVFLTNGQVYFGHLAKESSQYPVLTDIYYLQVNQPSQSLQPSENSSANINLVKLGGELHGPQDEMRVSRDQILFIEDLKADSRVMQAIEQFKSTNQ